MRSWPFPDEKVNNEICAFAVNLGPTLEYVDLEYINHSALSLKRFRIVRSDGSDQEGISVECYESRPIFTQ